MSADPPEQPNDDEASVSGRDIDSSIKEAPAATVTPATVTPAGAAPTVSPTAAVDGSAYQQEPDEDVADTQEHSTLLALADPEEKLKEEPPPGPAADKKPDTRSPRAPAESPAAPTPPQASPAKSLTPAESPARGGGAPLPGPAPTPAGPAPAVDSILLAGKKPLPHVKKKRSHQPKV